MNDCQLQSKSKSKTSFTVANISQVLNPSHQMGYSRMCGFRGQNGLALNSFIFHFPFFPPPFSVAHKRLCPVSDVAEELSHNELITDKSRRAFESWHRTTFFRHLNIVTVVFFQICFSHRRAVGHPLLAFLETRIITRFFFYFLLTLSLFFFLLLEFV